MSPLFDVSESRTTGSRGKSVQQRKVRYCGVTKKREHSAAPQFAPRESPPTSGIAKGLLLIIPDRVVRDVGLGNEQVLPKVDKSTKPLVVVFLPIDD